MHLLSKLRPLSFEHFVPILDLSILSHEEIERLANFDPLVLFGDVARGSFVRSERRDLERSGGNERSVEADLAVEVIRCGLEVLEEAFERSEIGVSRQEAGRADFGRDFDRKQLQEKTTSVISTSGQLLDPILPS